MSFNLIGDKGGGTATFKSRPDTLRSNDSFEMLLGLGSGRWKGLKQGLRSIEVNDVPLENEDGTSNFKDFVVLFADGDPAQTQRVDFKLGGGGGTTTVNTQIGNTNSGVPGPWVTAAVTTPGADFIDVRLIISQLYYQDAKGIRENTMTLEVNMRPTGSSNWINPLSSNAAPTYTPQGYNVSDGYDGVLKGYMLAQNWSNSNTWNDPNPGYMVINDKTSSPSVKELRIAVPNTGAYANKTWEIRIRLIEPELRQADPVEERRVVQWESVAAITKTILGTDPAWRGLAWLQVVGKASEQLSGVPSLKGIYETKIVKTPPSNIFDPATRQYTGTVWDGSYSLNYTNDPAWCLKDLIEDSVSGIAALSPGASLDKWDALDASKYFSQLVPNGKGGTHPRFSMNLNIDQAQNTEDLIQYIAGAVNALAVDTGDSKWRLKVDKPEAPVALFTRDNIVEDFQYSHTDVDSRFNDITVSFVNAENRYQEDRVRVYDQAHIDRFGRKPTTIVAVGCNNRQEALRRAMFRLRVSTNETRLVTFSTNRQGKNIQPLNVILVADTDLAYLGSTNRTSSRIINISGTTITLGSDVRLESGVSYQVNVTVPNPDYNPDTATQPGSVNWQKPTITITRNLTNSATQRGNVTTLYLDSALPANTPVNAPVALSAVGLPSIPVQYRVVEVSHADDGEMVSIQALVVDTGKWEAMDNVSETAILGQISDTRVPPPLAPHSGMFKILSFVSDFQTKRVLALNWERPGSLFLAGFRVESQFNDGPWQIVSELMTQNYLEIQQPQAGKYAYRIASVDRMDRMSAWLQDSVIVDDVAEDYAPVHGVGPFNNRPESGSKEGDKYTTTDQNPNVTYIWHNNVWMLESNFVNRADQVAYTDGTPVQNLRPAQAGATVGGTIGSNIRNSDGTLFDPGAAGGGSNDYVPPAQVTNLTMTSTLTDGATADLTLSWTPSGADDLAGYDVEVKEGGGNFIGYMTTNTPYKLTGQKRNQAYVARVRAFDRAGNRGSWSSEVSYTTVRDTTAPGPASEISAVPAYNSAQITWRVAADPDIVRCNVFVRKISDNSQPFQSWINVTPNTRNTLTASGLEKGTAYYILVNTFDSSGNNSGQVRGTDFTTAGGVAAGDFTPGIAPVATVATLPNASGYTGPTVVFNQADGKLYRYVNGAFTTAVAGNDIGAGTLPGTALIPNTSIPSTLIVGGVFGANSVADAFKRANWDDVSGGANRPADYAGTSVSLIPLGNTANVSLAGNSGRAIGAAAYVSAVQTKEAYKGSAIVSARLSIDGNQAKRIVIGLVPSNNTRGDASYGVMIGFGLFLNTAENKAYTIAGTDGIIRTAGPAITAADVAQLVYTGTKISAQINGIEFDSISVPEGLTVSGHVALAEEGAFKDLRFDIGTNNAWSTVEGTNKPQDNATVGAPNGTYVGLTAAETVEIRANNPAGRINENTVTVNGGKLTAGTVDTLQLNASAVTTAKLAALAITADKIAANAVVADKIAANAVVADKIAANAVTTGKLVVASRPVSVIGMNIRIDNDGIMRWDAGTVNVISDTGNVQSYSVAAGSTPDSPMYLLYVPGRTALDYVNNVDFLADPMHIKLAYRDGMKLTQYAGVGTLINGGQIVTQSITTNQIAANTITANNILAGTITAALIASNAITTEKLAVGSVNSTIIADGAITTPKITVGSLNGDRIATNTLDAATIKANTLLAGSIQVSTTFGNQTLTTVGNLALNPAARINEYTTTIEPGKITISGTTTLANWRQGGDETRIAGGSISANTITANKLTIGNRNINFVDISFFTSENGGRLNWTSGFAQYTNSNGVQTQVAISAGSTTLDNYVYIYWTEGATFLQATTASGTVAGTDSYITLCTWLRGQKYFLLNYGSTIVDGDRILTGTIEANRLRVNTLSSITADIGEVTAGTIRNTANTVRFDLNTGLQITIAGNYRKVTGAAFGANGDLMEWWGLNSVAYGSETKENSVFALATNGLIYFGTAPVGAGAGGGNDNGIKLNGSVDVYTNTATPVNSNFVASAGKYRLYLSGKNAVIDNVNGGGDARIQIIAKVNGNTIFQGVVSIPVDGSMPDFNSLADAFGNIFTLGAANSNFQIESVKIGGAGQPNGHFNLTYALEKVGN